jgi:predicted esterase
VIEKVAAASVHGRYLVIPADGAGPDGGPSPILAGFHGYGEDAEKQLERLRSIPGTEHWLKISIQALHPFYDRRTNRVVANWMTRQHRHFAIADNIAWVETCIDEAAREFNGSSHIVFAGFSQGVAMAFRGAAHSKRSVTAVIAAGGDVPPDLTDEGLHNIGKVILARGLTDAWYSPEKFLGDQTRLREAAVPLETIEFDGGHEWSPALAAAASRLLTSPGQL